MDSMKVGSAGPATADTSRLATRANLEKAAQQFEGIFVTMMMKSMRATSFGDGLFDNEATRTFREMQDQKVAGTIAEHGSFGLAKAMTEFLTRGRPDLAEPKTTKAVDGPAMLAEAAAVGMGPSAATPIAGATGDDVK